MSAICYVEQPTPIGAKAAVCVTCDPDGLLMERVSDIAIHDAMWPGHKVTWLRGEVV